MKAKETVKRYFLFFIGLLLNAFGVAFTTKALLGASPIAAIPYSLSLIAPRLTMGNYVIIYNVLLVLLEWAILRKRANKLELLLQALMAFFFGYFTDFSLWVLKGMSPGNYVLKIVFLVIGCCILALGVCFELIGNVVMLPGNAFSKAISDVSGKKYGTIRVICDISMTVIAGALCLIFLGKLSGVREGTVIAAFLVGNIVTLWNKLLAKPFDGLRSWVKK